MTHGELELSDSRRYQEETQYGVVVAATGRRFPPLRCRQRCQTTTFDCRGPDGDDERKEHEVELDKRNVRCETIQNDDDVRRKVDDDDFAVAENDVDKRMDHSKRFSAPSETENIAGVDSSLPSYELVQRDPSAIEATKQVFEDDQDEGRERSYSEHGCDQKNSLILDELLISLKVVPRRDD